MKSLDDLSYFVAVVRHQGFSAAARATGIDKTRLSRRLAALEQRLGVCLLQRNTRHITLTEAGSRFYADCLQVVDGAHQAYQNVEILRGEPIGTIQIACPPHLASGYLTRILPAYLAAHPKVCVKLELGDTDVGNPNCDVAIRSTVPAGGQSEVVARVLGRTPRVLLASGDYLDRHGRPQTPDAMASLEAIALPYEVRAGHVHWRLMGSRGHATMVSLSPRLQTGDLQMQLSAVAQGLGVASLPVAAVGTMANTARLERVLPKWTMPDDIIYAIYANPRGMLPSVRSLIDYLVAHPPVAASGRGGNHSYSFAL
ncbi:LysR substrate-binding domain-containing protein [Duganella sp. SG902]|uniref:LysR substrate-binding domain-containing protein n=1 Tax=Duganella sp. SG902 TaxID=2587016 RepID=UPI001E64A959|nr:LysR substrate-binding domain-containing protein [Duganella sp. SG902]